ncbi:5-amino-6-(5-phosphoribosylamino)uracil reductase [Nocardia amikacinitolerans]|uniref:RibD family protein n=1 Tax=Nocardia amikacinitolerans TaxID=756689 RepID=UPI00082BC027|nr:dihydrofolate reductase family protein [Nocardia amikacinitolerans]MCP2319011.1 5-amino-6-(5-phosphoribosylamino)uracil reductase [Nocardia amikacinitolerans]
MTRPFVLLSVAVSIDGYIDDTGPDRLLLSNPEDFDRVDQVRAECDAILIGAETVRSDNPRLIVKSHARQSERAATGRTSQPLKVTVTESGNLDPEAKFWHHGTAEHRPVVYTTKAGAQKASERLGELASVVALGETVDFGALLDDLGRRGVGRLMVEGGSHMHTAFLSAGLADELHLAIGPTLVGDSAAPRFVNPARFPGGSTHRMRLVEVTQLGDVAVLRYHPKENQ